MSYVNDQTYTKETTKFGNGEYKTAYTGALWTEGGVATPYALAIRVQNQE